MKGFISDTLLLSLTPFLHTPLLYHSLPFFFFCSFCMAFLHGRMQWSSLFPLLASSSLLYPSLHVHKYSLFSSHFYSYCSLKYLHQPVLPLLFPLPKRHTRRLSFPRLFLSCFLSLLPFSPQPHYHLYSLSNSNIHFILSIFFFSSTFT